MSHNLDEYPLAMTIDPETGKPMPKVAVLGGGGSGGQGPKGDKGDPGPEGPQGPQGIPGPKGEKGDPGEPGPQGPKGDNGADGTGIKILGSVSDPSLLPMDDNEIGDAYIIDDGDENTSNEKEGHIYVWTGVAWNDGGNIKGPKGDIGPQGPKGDIGQQGPKGEQGDIGPEGPQGIQGPKGDTGEQGPQGIQGPKGDTGEQGPQGVQGLEGLQGEKGEQGVQGIPGPEGPEGLPGKDADISSLATKEELDTEREARLTHERLTVAESPVNGMEYKDGYLLILKDGVWEAFKGADIYQEGVVKTDTSNAIGIHTFTKPVQYLYRVKSSNIDTKLLNLTDIKGITVGSTIFIRVINQLKDIETIVTSIDDLKLTITVDSELPPGAYAVYTSDEISNMKYQTAEGYSTMASGTNSHAEGNRTIASGGNSHAQGNSTVSSGGNSHAEGNRTMASGGNSHAEGSNTMASGTNSHAEGSSTISSGGNSHAQGINTVSSGGNSHAEGNRTMASGTNSHAEGFNTIANAFSSHAGGQYNKELDGSPTSFSRSSDAFAIGNGTSPSARSNAFRVSFDGNVYGLAAFNATGADYAEYFEWLDGNIDDEDRAGFVVTIDGEKILKANSEDTYILGVVSTNPSVIGDSHQDDWFDKYVTDDWGRIQHHWVDVEHEDYDDNGDPIKVIVQEYHPIYNPNWDPTAEYIPRAKRKEWSAVGLMGKLLVRDDGSCQINGHAKVGEIDGELTHSDQPTNMRVTGRMTDNIVRVFIK